MNWKHFFKLDRKKILITIILLGLTLFYSRKESIIASLGLPGFAYYFGFPLYYLKVQTGFEISLFPPISSQQLLNFIIDIIFWYILSCFIVLIYDKLQREEKMNWKNIFIPKKGVVILFLILFLFMFYFILPAFSSCRVRGIACRLDIEPESLCEQRNIEFKRNCEIYINTLTGIFFVLSYIISHQIVYTFGRTKVGKFISNYFWKLILLTILLIVLSFLYSYEPFVTDAYKLQRGWPFPYWEYSKSTWGYKPSTEVSGFIYPNLVLDFIFWYLLSCLIIWIWDKVKKKS